MICPLKVGKVSEFTTHKRNIDAFGVEKTNILIAVDNSSVWSNIIISVDNTKLPCYTLPPTQHHSFSRNLTPLFSSSVCCVTQRPGKRYYDLCSVREKRLYYIFSSCWHSHVIAEKCFSELGNVCWCISDDQMLLWLLLENSPILYHNGENPVPISDQSSSKPKGFLTFWNSCLRTHEIPQ